MNCLAIEITQSSMLDRLKPGDKIRFAAEKINGNYTVMRFEPAN